MTGYFENNRIYIELSVYGVVKTLAKKIKLHVDTGFDGHITLPFNEAIPLGLVLKGTQSYTLADGGNATNLVCWGNIEVDGKEYFVPIDVTNSGSPLLGQGFLKQAGLVMKADYSSDTVTYTIPKKKIVPPQKSDASSKSSEASPDASSAKK